MRSKRSIHGAKGHGTIRRPWPSRIIRTWTLSVVDVLEDGGSLVMELADASVGKHLKHGGHLSPVDVDEIVHACVAGLRYLHDMGCPHREVKPDNILCFEEGYTLGDQPPARDRGGASESFGAARKAGYRAHSGRALPLRGLARQRRGRPRRAGPDRGHGGNRGRPGVRRLRGHEPHRCGGLSTACLPAPTPVPTSRCSP